MPTWLMSALRTGAQSLGALLVGYLASKGIDLPVGAQDWIVQVILIGGGIALYTAAVRWLETRKGSSWPAVLARFVARLLHGFLPAPSYPTAPDAAARTAGYGPWTPR